MSTDPAINSRAATALSGKADLLAAPAMGNVVAPETTRASPARQPLLP